MLSSSLFSEWLEKTYLDDFGDPIDFRYIETSMTGSFSNIDGDNAVAYVKFICSSDSLLEFIISEYKQDNKVNFNNRVIYTLKVKDDKGIVTEYPELLATLKGKLCFVNAKKLIEQIKINNTLKMIIVDDEHRLIYKFTMDCIGFCKALKFL